MSLYIGEKLISGMRVGKTVISEVELQEKSVTPTKSPQVVTPDPTFDGLSKVNIEAVPDNYIDTSDANATSADMLVGSSGYVDGVKVEGSVTRNGAVSKSLNCGESYTIPEGHHNGLGNVTANSLASQTPGNAGADQIISGYSAWVNGVEVNGNASAGHDYEIVSYSGGTGTASIKSSFNTISHAIGCFYWEPGNGVWSNITSSYSVIGFHLGAVALVTSSDASCRNTTDYGVTFSNGTLTIKASSRAIAPMRIVFIK